MTRVLYLQLPRLDHDVRSPAENLPLAGRLLHHALVRDGLDAEARFETGMASDAVLMDRIVAWNPDLVAATLYLWNIERTLMLLRRIRRALPDARVCAGGPEAARGHPFLFRSTLADAVVTGEGEAVFPAVARALLAPRRGTAMPPAAADFDNVAWRAGRRYRWGRRPAPPVNLAASLPPPDEPCWAPDANGMTWLETGRGCPLRCAYCRYPQFRRRMDFLPAAGILARARAAIDRGARELRFIDPTLNAHPEFDVILAGLARLNRRRPAGRRLAIFGELLAERLTPRQIALLRPAGFTEIEAGMQSRDPAVLRAIRRPARLDALDANLRRLARAGIRVTLDLMYGLPAQRADEVLRSFRHAHRQRGMRVQCMQTLLLPGSELRERRRELGLRSDPRPPYGVRSTPSMTADDLRRVEREVVLRTAPDSPALRFVGRRLPDLFRERIVLDARRSFRTSESPQTARCALVFRGDDLYAGRDAILRAVAVALRGGRHALWQFVLAPAAEEPLDLLELVADEIRGHPRPWQDRTGAAAALGRMSSRRIFLLLRPGGLWSRGWIRAAEDLLSERFY